MKQGLVDQATEPATSGVGRGAVSAGAGQEASQLHQKRLWEQLGQSRNLKPHLQMRNYRP